MYSTESSFIELGLQFGLYFFILWVGIYMAAMEASDWPREEPQIDYCNVRVERGCDFALARRGPTRRHAMHMSAIGRGVGTRLRIVSTAIHCLFCFLSQIVQLVYWILVCYLAF